MLNKLTKISKKKQRVGRGIAAGRGKTAGRGTKGQKSRSGHSLPPRFEGGQTPLFARLPKVKGQGRGQSHKVRTIALNLDQLDAIYYDSEKVDAVSLKKKGLIKDVKGIRIKILSRGELKKKLDLSNCVLSANTAKKLKSPGGK